MLSEYRKAVISLIGAVVTILALTGVNVDPQLVAAITTVATSVLVFVVPNATRGN